jgi:tetratricopeptide (TPR) repeat protein
MSTPTPTDQLIQQALAAARTGDKTAARQALSQAVRQDPQNAHAWYLLSQVVEQPNRVIYCLEKVLKIDPSNEQAAKRLKSLQPIDSSPPAETAAETLSPSLWRSRLFLFALAALLLALVALIWYVSYGPCGRKRVDAAVIEIKAAAEKYTDAESIASSTGRIALSGPVMQMQNARHELMELEIPPCLEDARSDLAEAMDWEIGAYLLFMQESEQFAIDAKFQSAAYKTEQAAEELLRIQFCAPICSPRK